MTNPEDETRQTFCNDGRCNVQSHIQGDAGCFFANNEKLVEQLISDNQYTCYTYPAQNDAVERRRASSYARMIARLATKALAADNARLREALELADCTLSGANMNMNVVERKVRTALAALKGEGS